MNLCFFSDARAEHTRRWTKYFAQKGHQVDLITFNSDALPDYEPVRVHVLRKPRTGSDLLSCAWNLPSVLSDVRKVIRETHPHVIHAHSAGAYAWLAMASGFHPYVVTPWGTDILVDIHQSGWYRFLTLKALRRADLITCDAYHIRDEMVKAGLPEEKVRPIMFGVNLERFAGMAGSAESRNQHAEENFAVVISTRTLTPIHDVETFVRAVPLVKQRCAKTRFHIGADGSERPRLEELVDDLGSGIRSRSSAMAPKRRLHTGSAPPTCMSPRLWPMRVSQPAQPKPWLADSL